VQAAVIDVPVDGMTLVYVLLVAVKLLGV